MRDVTTANDEKWTTRCGIINDPNGADEETEGCARRSRRAGKCVRKKKRPGYVRMSGLEGNSEDDTPYGRLLRAAEIRENNQRAAQLMGASNAENTLGGRPRDIWKQPPKSSPEHNPSDDGSDLELPPVTEEAGRRQELFDAACGPNVVEPKPDGESSGMRTECLRDDSVKDQPRSMLSGKCVSFGDHTNEPNIRDSQDQRSWRQRQLIAWLHD